MLTEAAVSKIRCVIGLKENVREISSRWHRIVVNKLRMTAHRRDKEILENMKKEEEELTEGNDEMLD